jgi:hypothetical protein
MILDEGDVPTGPDVLSVGPANRVYYGVGGSLGHAFAVGKEI